MSVASDWVPYVIIYMGPILGFLGLSSFLWIKLTLEARQRHLVRQFVRISWGAGALFLVAIGLSASDAVSVYLIPQIYAVLGGAVLGASGILAAQYAAAGKRA